MAAEETLIKPSRGWSPIDLSELSEYRELLLFLVWRDVKVRYKQTLLGGAWAILQPVCGMVVFTVFFGKLAGIPSDGVPYQVFSLTGLVPWTFFSNGLSFSSNSLVANANLLKKVYFPRLIIPCATQLAGLVDLALAFLVLLGVMASMGIAPARNAVWLPFFLLLALVTSLGVGLWLSALNVMYRDVQYVIPFFVQLWLFLTPVVYPTSLVHERWRVLYALNPMVGVVEGFRWSLLGTGEGPGPVLLASTAVAVACLVSGAFYFRRMERTFADTV